MVLLAALASLTRLWVHGALPPAHATALCAANLTPLRYPDGGLRTGAVGDTLRRMVGKALLSTNASKSEVTKLAPLQTGIGLCGGAEAVAMGCQGMVDQLASQQGWVLLKVDMANAFNSVSRRAVLQGTVKYCPTAYNFLRFAYASSAPLYTGGSPPPFTPVSPTSASASASAAGMATRHGAGNAPWPPPTSSPCLPNRWWLTWPTRFLRSWRPSL